MKISSNIILPVFAAVGLVAGGLYSVIHQKQSQSNPPTAQQEQAATELRTDAFSLRIFQQMLDDKSGNVMVAPLAISQTLLKLETIAAGKTLEQLQALQLDKTRYKRDTGTDHASLVTIDMNVPRKQQAAQVLALPFSEDVPLALSIFNGALAQCMNRDNAQYATSDMVNERTRLLAGTVAAAHCKFETPFLSVHTRTADFDSASGAMPHYRQMRNRAGYRTAKAADGSWHAVALPFASRSKGKAPLVFIGILPSGSARDFAKGLTPEQLTDIRKALAEADPQDTLVELPRLDFVVQPYDMRYILRRLGLVSLFDSETADFSPLTEQKIHLGAMVYAAEASIQDTPTNQAAAQDLDYAKNYISFSRPFLWMITDLSTGSPLDFIGIVEEM